MNLISYSEEQTKNIACELVRKYQQILSKKCLIFALEGELGTGKTIFAKGVAKALGIKKIIRSPSFIIEKEFPYSINDLGGKFYHLDLWRMESEDEVAKLKIEDLIKPGNVILIEWAEKMTAMLEKLRDFRKVVLFSVKLSYLKRSLRKIEVKLFAEK